MSRQTANLEDVIATFGQPYDASQYFLAQTDGTGSGSDLSLTIPGKKGYFLQLLRLEVSFGDTPTTPAVTLTDSTASQAGGIVHQGYLPAESGVQGGAFPIAYQTGLGGSLTIAVTNDANNCPGSISAVANYVLDR